VSCVNVSQICLRVQEGLRSACSYFCQTYYSACVSGVTRWPLSMLSNVSLDEFCERWRYCCSCCYLQYAGAYSVHHISVTKKVITQSHLLGLAFPIFLYSRLILRVLSSLNIFRAEAPERVCDMNTLIAAILCEV